MAHRQAASSAGTVVAFAGHMIDAPGRASPRFPAGREQAVAAAVGGVLEQLGARAGVTALASGADLVFAEAMLSRGGEVHAVLPLNVEEFLAASVRPSGDGRWEERFHAVRARLASLEVHGDDYLRGSGTPFQMAALLIDGQARMLARERVWRATALGVWDGEAGDGLGGTASFMGHCVARGRETWAIHPMTGRVWQPGAEAARVAQKHTWGTVSAGETVLEHRLAAFVFADAKGFGKLNETQIPAFARVALGVVRAVIEEMPAPPLVLNTWGDGVFAVTESAEAAGALALGLVERARAIDWRREGLPGEVKFRVGLHAGPAFVTQRDPVIARPNAYGRDVSLAARIEPVVAPGEVWASRAFVVLAAATGEEGLEFTDLGERTLHKEARAMRLYAVRRG